MYLLYTHTHTLFSVINGNRKEMLQSKSRFLRMRTREEVKYGGGKPIEKMENDKGRMSEYVKKL